MKNQLSKLIEEYQSLQPFNEDCKKKLDKKFRLEFNYNSNHLEGNTLTYGETELLLLFDQTKGNHDLRELEEMKAHDVALIMIKEEAADKDKPLTEKFIKDLNQTILVRSFWKDAITSEGQSTRRQIKVGEYKEYPNSVIQANGEIFEYTSPQETPILMAELVKWYNEEVQKKEFSPIELAALLHYRYIRIHPFDDGNGRVARLLVNYVLYANDLSPVIIKTAEKKEYLHALQQADTGDLQAFVDYMTKQLAWSLDISIKAAKGESIEEQDDWEKQLKLLKKGLGDKNTEVVKKSEESVKAVFENVIKPFANKLDEKLSQFNSLFMECSFALQWNDTAYKYFDSFIDALDYIYKVFEMPDDSANYVNTEQLSIIYIFSKYRNPYREFRIESLLIKFAFSKNAYGVSFKDSGYGISYSPITKIYSDFLTTEEIDKIISDIGQDLLKRIEGLVNLYR
ncbi:MAG: Fic family protein [Dysgonomonas sp.]